MLYVTKISRQLAGASLLLFCLICGLTHSNAPLQPTGLAAQPQATPTPTGKIAFTSDRDGDSEIYVMNADGTNLQRLTSHPGIDQSPALSPEGCRVAFVSYRTGSFELYVMDAVDADGDGNGDNLRRLTATGADLFSPTWSHDGLKIAFESYMNGKDSEIYVVNADGSGLTNVTNHPDNDMAPEWSPVEDKIAFMRSRFDPVRSVVLSNIYVIKSDGTGATQLTTSVNVNKSIFNFIPGRTGCVLLPVTSSDEHPTWSPDGRRIAFMSSRTDHPVASSCPLSFSDLYVMNADGSNLRPLMIFQFSHSYRAPVWSSDGNHIVLTGEDEDLGYARFATLSIADGNAAEFPDDPINSSPSNYDLDWGKASPSCPNTPAGANVNLGAGAVNVTFSGVTAAGNTVVVPIDPAAAGTVPGGYKLGDNSLAFEITTTAQYTPPVTVCFNVPSVTDPAAFNALRILHGENGQLVDRTSRHDFAAKTVCAEVTSLSPFVLAERDASNRPPAARARDLEVAAGDSCSASVSAADIDAGSADPDAGDSLTLALEPAGPFGIGSHAVTLTATDGRGATSSASATITVVDRTPPAVSAPADLTAGTGADSCSAVLSVGAATATDCSAFTVTGTRSDGRPLDSPYPRGATRITWTATDAAGNTASASQTITVNDTEAPVISGAYASPGLLWPPNHTMRKVSVAYTASDNCGAANCVISSVTSDEPVNGTGDGDTAPDWEIVDSHRIRLRAERAGGSNGRTYTITVTCTDSHGNSSSRAVTVRVPKSRD